MRSPWRLSRIRLLYFLLQPLDLFLLFVDRVFPGVLFVQEPDEAGQAQDEGTGDGGQGEVSAAASAGVAAEEVVERLAGLGLTVGARQTPRPGGQQQDQEGGQG